jgi:A/G-specific adenine glycosylase
MNQHFGAFPSTLDALQKLPGIGRSTAGAILSLAMQQPATILDGNVKRVLARFHAVNGWPGSKAVSDRLWKLAESHTPTGATDAAVHTQAIMDLGATICTRSRPKCADCPLQPSCQAANQSMQNLLPATRPKPVRPTRQIKMLLIVAEGSVLLEKRPPTGIWGGLWSLPESEISADTEGWMALNFPGQLWNASPMRGLKHNFTHFQLDIQAMKINLAQPPDQILEPERYLWYNLAKPPTVGMATPVHKLVKQLE